jgi:hypothetical protein
MARISMIAAVAALSAGSAHAQGEGISDSATYGDAVVCYQYYSVAKELARKLEKSPRATADQAAGFELQALAANKALASWSRRIGEAAGNRTRAEIDADVKKLGAPVVADANAALRGDKSAAARGLARGDKCARFELAGNSQN